MTIINITLNEDQTEGTKAVISQWLYAKGDVVEKDQPILEIETDKVMMEIIAPVTGTLTEKLLNSGDEVAVSAIIGKIDSDINLAEKPAALVIPEKINKNTSAEVINNLTINTNSSKLISPSVRRLINQHNINVNNLNGSGKNNRITSRDIENYLKNPVVQDSSSQNNTSSKHVAISNMRKSIAKHMVDSLLHTAPHVTSVFNLDLSAIIKHRKLHKKGFEEQGAGLTFTSYFIAASAVAIKQQPLINSQLHKDSIEIFNSINIGIGTALNDEGLIVPVLKNCEERNLLSVSKELTRLTNKARSNKLKPSDVKDGTFTISNHGVSGSLIATPIIISQPQSAILGIGKMEKRVVVKEVDGDDVMLIKPMCFVTLTIDHRVLDAHQCNQFLSIFVETLENWQ